MMETEITEIPADNEIQSSRGQPEDSDSYQSWYSQYRRTFPTRSVIRQVPKNICIYKVPKRIKDSKVEAYVPENASFGPYYWDVFYGADRHMVDPLLLGIVKLKEDALYAMLARLQIDETTLIREIQDLEDGVRQCYNELIPLEGKNLYWPLTLDVSFILEFIRAEDINHCCVCRIADTQNSNYHIILNDILKLENQIPLFALIRVLEIECPSLEAAKRKLAGILSKHSVFCGFPFARNSHDYAKTKLQRYLMNEPSPCHLLDLYRMVIRDALMTSDVESAWEEETYRDDRSTSTAEYLNKVGIDFKPGALKFVRRWLGKSTFFLPHIEVNEHTEILLRNLMAYEECHRSSINLGKTIISHYARLFNDLIDSQRDVAVMRKSLIIRSDLGSEKAIAIMFNSLGDGLTFSGVPEIDKAMEECRQHCKTLRKVWLSEFRENYCSKPWFIVSLGVSALLVGMTATQTVFSVKK